MVASTAVRPDTASTLAALTLAVGLAAPTIASAQTPAPGTLPAGALLVVDAGGNPIGVLMPTAAPQMVEPDPLAEMMALQTAMLRQMQAQMTDVAQVAAGPRGDVASSLVIRSVTTGADGCSRTTVWRQGPSDAAPKMVVDQVADRCASAGPGSAGALPARSAPPVAGLQAIVDVHAPAKPVRTRPF